MNNWPYSSQPMERTLRTLQQACGFFHRLSAGPLAQQND